MGRRRSSATAVARRRLQGRPPSATWRTLGNDLTAAEAFDVSGRGGTTSTWTDSTGGLSVRFKKASLVETVLVEAGDQLAFARILLRRHFRDL